MSDITYFVDNVSGQDTGVGYDFDYPFQTISRAMATILPGDSIYILHTGVEIDETVIVSKANISLIGENASVTIAPMVPGTTTLAATGGSLHLKNLILKTALGGTDSALTMTGIDVSKMENIRLESSTGINGVFTDCTKGKFIDSFSGYALSHGLHYHNCVDMDTLNCHIDSNGGDNIRFTADNDGDTHEVILRNTIIHESGFDTGVGYGLNIGTGCETIQIFPDCNFILNASGDILDNGITTYNGLDDRTDRVWNHSKGKLAALNIIK